MTGDQGEQAGGESVTAVVVAFESAGVLPECLDALRTARVPAIVVDNASLDASAEVARAHGAHALVQSVNHGYGRANNIGVEAADGAAWCLLVNPDLVVAPDTVARLLAVAKAHPKAAMLVPRIVEADGSVFEHEVTLLSPVAPPLPATAALGDGVREVAFASGACMLVRRDVFRALGSFDPAIFLFYEDDDLCLRLRQAGWQILHVEGASVRHGRGKSSAPGKGRSYVSRYHQAWSRRYVQQKHGLDASSIGFLAKNAVKLAGAALVLDRRRMERYRGSVAGTLASYRGKPAFDGEGTR